MKNKFNLIFIIGLEGSGHHLYKNLKINLSSPKIIQMHNLILQYFNKGGDPRNLIKIRNKMFDFTKKNIGSSFYESSSFPFGRPTSPLNCIEILGFYELLKSIPHINFYFIVNTRNIIYSTLSIQKRTNDKIIWSTRLQESCLLYINSQIQLIPKEKYVITDLDNISENIDKFEKYLKEKTKMDIYFNKNNVFKQNNLKYLKYKNYNYVFYYFSKKRMEQFNFLKNNTTLF